MLLLRGSFQSTRLGVPSSLWEAGETWETEMPCLPSEWGTQRPQSITWDALILSWCSMQFSVRAWESPPKLSNGAKIRGFWEYKEGDGPNLVG